MSDIETFINDENFISTLENIKNEDEIISLLKEKGYEITAEEIKSMQASSEKEELNESVLDAVSGGSVAYALGYTVARWLKSKYSSGAFGGGGGGSR